MVTIAQYMVASQRAERIQAALYGRAVALGNVAGIGCQFGTTGHNALVDCERGKPWLGVDYRALREAFHMLERRNAVNAILYSLWLKCDVRGRTW